MEIFAKYSLNIPDILKENSDENNKIIYKGELDNLGNIHGNGEIYNEKFNIIGIFQHGSANIKDCRLIVFNGINFWGDVEDNMFTGEKSKIIFPNNIEYFGTLKYSYPDEYGELYIPDKFYKYIGKWNNGFKSGFGWEEYKIGDNLIERYMGNWENDVRSGFGIIKTKNVRLYVIYENGFEQKIITEKEKYLENKLQKLKFEISLQKFLLKIKNQNSNEIKNNDSIICKICYQKNAKFIFLPCSHLVLCETCIEHLEDKSRCIICRKIAKKINKVYY